jgi:hypothetical protein
MFEVSIQSLAVAEGQIACSGGSTENYRILAWREGRRVWERSRHSAGCVTYGPG